MTAPTDDSDSADLYTNRYEGASGERIDLRVDAQMRSHVVHIGKGSVAGTRAAIVMFEEVKALLGADVRTVTLVDIRGLYDAPIRSQLILGKWLLKNKAQLKRLAVFGGHAWEMKLARALSKMAGLASVTGFFQREAEARAYLGW